MTIEILGLIHPHDRSETRHADGEVIDRDYIRRLATTFEASDFDRVLVGYSSSGPDGLQIGAYVAAHTEHLGLLIAHRAGVQAPTSAARAFATLDHLSGGRVALHAITGRDDREQRREGDYVTKADRYARTGEYIDLLRRAWGSTEPVSADGRFYRFEDFESFVHPRQDPSIPIFFAGSSDEAYEVGAAQADVYVFYAQPLDALAADIRRVHEAAERAGRSEPPAIGIIVRPILGDSDEQAWDRARGILDITRERLATGQPMMRGSRDMDGPEASVGDRRQLEHHARGEVHDTALWTAVAAATQRGNATALVGSTDTVASALAAYAEIGVSRFFLHGFDPLADASAFGEGLVPTLRSLTGSPTATAAPRA